MSDTELMTLTMTREMFEQLRTLFNDNVLHGEQNKRISLKLDEIEPGVAVLFATCYGWDAPNDQFEAPLTEDSE